MKVGFTGWFSWPPVYCMILEINGDILTVETEDGQRDEIKASEFQSTYMVKNETLLRQAE